MNKIKVLIKQPGKPCEERDIEPKLETFRSIVGGHIESCHCPGLTTLGGIMAYCNEEGKLLGLQPNFVIADRAGNVLDIIVGTVVFFRNQGEDEVSLTKGDIERIRIYTDVRDVN